MAPRNFGVPDHGGSRAWWFAAAALAASLIAPNTGHAGWQAQRPSDTSKALFCAYGSVGLTPPPDFHFAVAVVEIASSRDILNAAVSDFALYDRSGTVTRFKRVVEVEEFKVDSKQRIVCFETALYSGVQA